MAKFRLLSAHQMRNNIFNTDVWLPGDKENDHLGDERGTIVGDGTPYPVVSATLEMAALDEEAEAALEVERERIARGAASMDPVGQLPILMDALNAGRDDYDRRYTPGFPGQQRPQAKSKET